MPQNVNTSNADTRIFPASWLALKRLAARLSGWLMTPLDWLFVRLPSGFTFPFLATAVPYFLIIFPLVIIFAFFLVYFLLAICFALVFVALNLLGFVSSSNLSWMEVARLAVTFIPLVSAGVIIGLIIFSLLTLGSATLGLFGSYGLAGKIYSRRRSRRASHTPPPIPLLPSTSDADRDAANPLAPFNRIGIILSGGGAKGAYQAGALQAIYEFLEENNAHGKVRVVAGTSIGSWNALFWLAGLVKKNGDGTSPLERWWKNISLGNIVQPITYVPTRKNHFLSNEPWRKNFDALFGGNDGNAPTKAGEELMARVAAGGDEDALHFYFTRSNIGKASLAFTSNRPKPEAEDQQFSVKGDYYEATSLACIRDGVFASMDIPPLFQYLEDKEKKNYFEDGGVIDNLPISFGTAEECDLLFILPLNASFERGVDQRSVFRRLARVTEVRQGVLERNSFKMIYLYNQLASLSSRVNELEKRAKDAATPANADSPDGAKMEANETRKEDGDDSQNRAAPEAQADSSPAVSASVGEREAQADAGDELKKRIERKTADMALKKERQIVRVFSVCPASELKISTTEFWKTREAGEAFDFMYHATKNELKKFSQIVNSKYLRMIKISPPSDSPGASAEAASQPGVDEDATSDVRPIRKVTDAVTYDVLYFKDF